MKRTFRKYPSGYVRANSKGTSLSSKWKIGDCVYCDDYPSGWGTIVGFEDGKALVELEDGYDNAGEIVKTSCIYESADETIDESRKAWEEYRDKYPRRPLR